MSLFPSNFDHSDSFTINKWEFMRAENNQQAEDCPQAQGQNNQVGKVKCILNRKAERAQGLKSNKEGILRIQMSGSLFLN